MFKKIGLTFLPALMACAFLLVLVACDTDPEPINDLEFKGELAIEARTYDAVLIGQEDGTFELKVGQFDPILGTYVLIEGRGYVFYFQDYLQTIKRTTWDDTTKLFTLKYVIDLGSSRGKGEAVLTHEQSDFVETDELDWPFIPFSFYGEQEVMGGMAFVTTTLTLFEDGTVDVAGSTTAGTFAPRSGTWTYNEETDTYYFTLSDFEDLFGAHPPLEYEVPFDEETGTYHFDLHVNVVMTVIVPISYNPNE